MAYLAAIARLGRWKMHNAYGPENLALTLMAQVEYLASGGSFIVNTLDSCSDVTSLFSTVPAGPSNITVGAGSSNFSVDNNQIISHNPALLFSAPGQGNTGSISITIDLSSQPWLMFNWQGSGLMSHADITANFRRYRGRDRIIYWREVRD